MKAEVYIPEDRRGWWGGPDQRPRCRADDKVVFETEEGAARSAMKASARGTPMHSYVGKCGHWHTARSWKRNVS